MLQDKNRIHCLKSDFRTARVIALCHHLGLSYTLHFLDKETYYKDEELLKLSPFGKTPVLELNIDSFYEANTAIRYLSKKVKDRGLTGIIPRQEAKID